MLQSRPGGIVRTQGDPMTAIMPLSHPPLPPTSFSLVEYMDTMKEKRTGVTAYNQGLDANSLNKTASGVAQIMSAAQQRIELVARTFAETGVKSLFKGILHLLGKYQDKERILRIEGKYVPFDPRTWTNEFDVSINVGLGSGNKDQQLAMLQMILAKQEQVLQGYGTANPLVTVGKYRNTLAKFIEAAGFKDATVFINEITPEQDAQFAQPQPPSPDAQAEVARMLAEVEREKTQAKAANDAAQLQLKTQQLEAEYTAKGIELSQKQQASEADMKIREAELAVKQLQAILAMDLADEDSRNRQADIVLKAIRELGSLTK
jgi:hypothetical protein